MMLRRLLLASLLLLSFTTYAQKEDTAQYIHNAWKDLTRSTHDCASLRDIKVTERPFLYLPADQRPYPPEVAEMQNKCRVQVEFLPRRIFNIADIKPEELPRNGLLYLPNAYVVPGGRFNEMYGWDSYFILLGLITDGQEDLARGMVENFFFEIDHYGALLNANRTYYLTRSQPPLLAEMIRNVMEGKHAPDKAWLQHAYDEASKDYILWEMSAHHAGKTGLTRYKDFGEGPVPEMADDSDYYKDVIRWMQGHSHAAAQYLVYSNRNPDAKEKEHLRNVSCDVDKSPVCARAILANSRLSKAFYDGDRAMRESGFDTSFRFGPFSGSTEQYAPVCLNSLLYKYEVDMASFATQLGKAEDAAMWQQRADNRRKAMQKYLWDGHRFTDYNFVTKKHSTYHYITEFYPLWAGWATKQQAAATQKHLSDYEHKGGLAMSDNRSGTQWDEPYGWAPTHWFAVEGLAAYGYNDDAKRIAAKFTQTVDSNFAKEGTIREKYDMENPIDEVKVTTGYKSNVTGFGWTNAVYLRFKELLAQGGSLKAQESKHE